MNNEIDKNRIEQLLAKAKSKERRSTTFSLAFVALIVLLTTIWLIYTRNQITYATNQITHLKEEKNELKKDILLLQNKLDSTSLISKNIVEVDLTEAKHLYSEDRCAAKILSDMLEMKRRKTSFDVYNKNGNYNSPTFINMILKQSHVVRLIRATEMKSGDIVTYKSGYKMLYIKQNDSYGSKKEYCVGMTPWGILALKKDFAEVILIERPLYQNNCEHFY